MDNNYVRNPEGIWINSKVFTEEADAFKRNGYYCPEKRGTHGYREYWEEQLRRCIHGHEVGGVKITGHHYNYLNFTRIMKLAPGATKRTGRKIEDFPDFWDGDYNFFWSLDIARNGISHEELKGLKLMVDPHEEYLDGGHHLIVGKARRKGYSFKNASICANTYNTQRRSMTVIGAFDKKYLYPEGTMDMVTKYLSFYNEQTAWGKGRDFVNKQDHKRASYLKTTAEGLPIESGYLSNVMALTFGDNPDAARGKDAKYIFFEEAGKFPNLRKSFITTEATLTAGGFFTGQMIVFGTGGDMESGTTDFAYMFYNPKEFNCLSFKNVWDDDAASTFCSFFHPYNWNSEGYYDEQGNSDAEGAKNHELGVRKKLLQNSSSSTTLQDRVQEHSLSPQEAFLMVSTNKFPVIELRNRLNRVLREQLYLLNGQPVELGYIDGKPKATPIFDNNAEPVWLYRHKGNSILGCPVIYEFPVDNPPPGLYKMGYDPVRQEEVVGDNPSLNAIYVYKTILKGGFSYNKIVASYIGRPSSTDGANRIAEILCELYNCQVMFENEVTHTRDYFIRKKKIHRLALQPDTAIQRVVSGSRVSREFGMHMHEKIKDAGEKYIKTWFETVRGYDEQGRTITNIDFIDDPGFLEEAISYNRKGNFDRIMSFMMVMFQIADEEEDKEYESTNTQKKLKESFQRLMDRQFSK